MTRPGIEPRSPGSLTEIFIKKENLPNCELYHSIGLKIKGNERKKNSTWTLSENSKTLEHESDGDTNCNWCTWNDCQRLGKGAGRVGNRMTSRNHPNYSIVKISQDIDKIPGDLRPLAVTQTPVRHHNLSLARKTHNEYL